MENILVSIIEILIIGILIPFEEKLYLYIWLLPILFITIFQLLKNVKSEYDNFIQINIKSFMKSLIIDIVIFTIISILVYLIFYFFPRSRSYNAFILLIYLIINMNVFSKNFGLKINGLRIMNKGVLNKLRIVLNNFLIISPVYFLILEKRFPFLEGSMQIAMEITIIINICNVYFRYFVFKGKSLFEYILRINYTSE